MYLVALLVSASGIAALDWRYRIVGFVSPVRALIAVALGTTFFLVWDLAGIAAGVFVKGNSDMLLGVDLAPHLPLEEPVFLAFLCYFALVCTAAASRFLERRMRGDNRSIDKSELPPTELS